MARELFTKNDTSFHILCIDDDAEFLTGLKLELGKVYRYSAVTNLRDGLNIIQRETIDLVLMDIGLSNENGIDGLRQIKQFDSAIDVIMVTGHKDPAMIVTAIRSGAADYLCKPFEHEELIATIEKFQKICQMRNRHDALIEDLKAPDARSRLLGVSRTFCDVLARADRVKGHEANILIDGESGTGKELLARYIHNLENNPHRPFIAVNCAAIPETLIEAELFGFEKGAFTGATHRKIGKFELANHGDIFLDEISSLKLDLQAKILRTLQEKEVCRVGGSSTTKVEFRVLAATNEDLEMLVKKGLFRMDLFHRLCVIHLRMPPLRERLDDIPLLVKHFIEKHTKAGHHKEVEPEVFEELKRYNWPGNIRELENIIHNLIVMVPNGTIRMEDMAEWSNRKPDARQFDYNIGESISFEDCIRRAQKGYIENVLKITKGNKSKAAERLNMSRSTLHTKLKELGVD